MKRHINLLYKISVTFVLGLGIFCDLYKTSSVICLLSYYTLQSNIACFIAFFVISILEITGKDYKNSLYYLTKGTITIGIFLTALVYHCSLKQKVFWTEGITEDNYASFIVHVVTPILVILDYFIFDSKGFFKLIYPIYWVFFPLNYVLYVYTYSALGGEFYSIGGSRKFAYFFLDYKELGIWGVTKWMLFLALVFLGVSYLLVWFDHKWGKQKK